MLALIYYHIGHSETYLSAGNLPKKATNVKKDIRRIPKAMVCRVPIVGTPKIKCAAMRIYSAYWEICSHICHNSSRTLSNIMWETTTTDQNEVDVMPTFCR